MPDGSYLLLVKNGRDGSRGAPQIIRYNPENQRSFTVTGPGYISPAPSPDGKYIAATRTDNFGTDVVILDGATGAEILRVTDDDGLVLAGLVAGRRRHRLPPSRRQHRRPEDGNARRRGRAAGPIGETTSLTEVSGLDAASRPGWFIPAEELPAAQAAPSSAAPASSAPASTAP